jgi:uncharacterized cupin superfamily protein
LTTTMVTTTTLPLLVSALSIKITSVTSLGRSPQNYYYQNPSGESGLKMSSSSRNYLSSLTLHNVGDDLDYKAPLKKFPLRLRTDSSKSNSNSNVTFIHAPISYFAIDQLTFIGPRPNADVGTPQESSRLLLPRHVETTTTTTISSSSSIIRQDNDSTSSLSTGSWWCTRGGWPSKTLRTTTEIFYVWQGFGCLTDLDGQRNFFGPGDTVILPKGWSGRWDIAEPVHKVMTLTCVLICHVLCVYIRKRTATVFVDVVERYNNFM